MNNVYCNTRGLVAALLVCRAVDEGAAAAAAATATASSSAVDDRGQLAECLAFISDMALTGDSSSDPPAAPAAAQPPVTSPHDDAPVAPPPPPGDQVDDEPVPEPTDAGPGRSRWLRHRLARLRLQRQRSAPGPAASAAAGFSASLDDNVSSHIQILNSLDSQVSALHSCQWVGLTHGLGWVGSGRDFSVF